MLNLPRIITAGDNYSWIDELSKYRSQEYILSHLIRGEKSKLDIFAATRETGYYSVITAQESALFAPGKYWVQIQLAKPDDRITLDCIEIEVKPNFANLSSYDGRSPDERELDAVSQAIVDISNKGISEYQIKGRQVVYQDLNNLIRLRDRLRARIGKARNGGKSRNCYISFR